MIAEPGNLVCGTRERLVPMSQPWLEAFEGHRYSAGQAGHIANEAAGAWQPSGLITVAKASDSPLRALQ